MRNNNCHKSNPNSPSELNLLFWALKFTNKTQSNVICISPDYIIYPISNGKFFAVGGVPDSNNFIKLLQLCANAFSMSNKKQSKKLQEEIARFLEDTPPARLSRNLRKMLLSYCATFRDGHGLDLEDLLLDLSSLFELLDTAHDELS